MADIFTQWLGSSSSTTSTYDDIQGSLGLPSETTNMSRFQDSNRAPFSGSSGNTRGNRSSTRGRGGHEGEYRTHQKPSQIDFYAAVDSWRSYSDGSNALQTNSVGQMNMGTGFDPYNQVFRGRPRENQHTVQNHHIPHNAYYQRSNVWYPNQVPAQTLSYQQRSDNAAPDQHGAQWVQNSQGQADAPIAHVTQAQPMRSVPEGARYHPYRVDIAHRFSNDLHGRQQAYNPPSGSWRATQPTFSYQIPMRPSRGAERPRGYASTRDQPHATREQDHTAKNHATIGPSNVRHNLARQNTPRRDFAGAAPPTPPVASQAYLAQAHLQPGELKTPRRLLVVLDFNGTLMLKPNYRKPNEFHIRPGATELLEYLFANHTVMAYTSGQPHNAEIVARGLFSKVQYDKLAAIWARDKLDLTQAQYRGKVQVYKKLDKVWKNNEIQASFFPPGSGRWDQTNTVLVDDSHLKALQEPHNLLQVTEFTGQRDGLHKKAYSNNEEQVCRSLIMKLEVLKWQNDVSRLIWRWQTGKAEIPKVPGSNFFVDEKVDQKEQARRDLEAAMNLPTPQSPMTTDSEGSEDEGLSLLPPKHLESSVSTDGRRSESPVDEVIFKHLLADRKNARGGRPTPESLSG